MFQSKGGILSKACEYIKELRQSNLKLGEDAGALDRVRMDNQLLRQEVGPAPGPALAPGEAPPSREHADPPLSAPPPFR